MRSSIRRSRTRRIKASRGGKTAAHLSRCWPRHQRRQRSFSHRLSRPHRTEADSLDTRRILTCAVPDSGALAARMALIYGSKAGGSSPSERAQVTGPYPAPGRGLFGVGGSHVGSHDGRSGRRCAVASPGLTRRSLLRTLAPARRTGQDKQPV